MDVLPFLANLSVRSFLVLALALLLCAGLRRASAAERHLLVLLGLIVATLLPFGLLFAPRIFWDVTLPAPKSPPVVVEMLPASSGIGSPTEPAVSPALPPATAPIMTVANGIMVLLGGGALLQVLIIYRAAAFWQRVWRTSRPVSLPASVLGQVQLFADGKALPPVHVSDEIVVPVLVGWLRPIILLPRAALQDREQALAMVLCHELAHFRRGDSRLLPLLVLVRVFYWWHPLAWLALARLRRERESACDDRVLGRNFRASDYADLIVNAARALKTNRPITLGALAMATSSSVGGRINAVLNPNLRRRAVSRFAAVAGIAVALGIGWSLSATQLRAITPAAAASPTGPNIQLEFRLIRIDEKAYAGRKKEIDGDIDRNDLTSLINLLKNLPGASLLQAPTVTTQQGLQANVDILHDIRYATVFTKDKTGKVISSGFRDRNVGLSIEALPRLAADGKSVDLKYKCEVTTFRGWAKYPDNSLGEEPVFNTRRASSDDLIGPNGVAVWVGAEPTQNGSLEESLPAPDSVFPHEESPHRSLLLIFAHPVPAEPRIVAAPADQQNLMIRTALKFFQITEKTYSQQPSAIDAALQRGDIAFLSRFPDFNLLSEPTVLMKAGEQGTVESGRFISRAISADATGKPLDPLVINYGRRFVGLRVVEKPEITSPGYIDLDLFPEMTRYEGSIRTGGEVMPIFNTRHISMRLGMYDGKTVGLWVFPHGRDMSQNMRPAVQEPLSQIPVKIGLIVTSDICSQYGQLLRNPQPRRVEIMDKFNTLAIRKFVLHQANMGDVIQALTVASKEADPAHQGVNFVLNLDMSSPYPNPKFDLNLENVSPKEIVDSIVKQTGFTYSIDDYAVYLRRPSATDEQYLSVRTYLVPVAMSELLRDGASKHVQGPHPEGTTDVLEPLAALGFKFPPGASTVLINDSDKLVVRDTPEQLDAIMAYIEKLDPH
jgi:beta-lactamase regulating signal transducer with metallopeptidase domain